MKAPIPSDGARPLKELTAPEWGKDLLVSWLFQTCIKLQTSLDRCFLKFGLTTQEATLLLRCAEMQRTTPGKLAAIVGRDKGKVTRIIDRLASSGLVTREIYARDRRYSIIRATRKGKLLARELAHVFDSIRTELFLGIRESDVFQLGAILPHLHKNAVQLGSRHKCDVVRGRKRIGSQGMKTEGPQTNKPQIAADVLTPSPNGDATNTVPIGQEGHESEPIRHAQSGEERATPGKLVEEHKELVLK